MSKVSERMLGKRYKSKSCGYLVVESYHSCFKVGVLFLDTGSRMFFDSRNIRSGNVRDPYSPNVCGVGFIGTGSYNSRHRAYRVWASMIARCYDEKTQEIKPTYKGCTVCDEWHNFQNFASWFDDNHYLSNANLELDKDLLKKGNKIYCPEFCCFISGHTNRSIAAARRYKFTSPEGEVTHIYNLSKFCNEHKLIATHMSAVYLGNRNSHKGWTR